MPSTLSAFKPVATPVAFVVNGAALALVAVIEPTCVAAAFVELNSKARPEARLLARMHGSLPFGVPPAPERQP